MDNFKLISNNEQVPSNQLIPESSTNRIELGIEQVGNLTYKSAGATMLDEVTNHFKTTFSNVSKGEANASEYLEVGALAVGTAALAAVGVGKLMQRTFPTLKTTVAEEGFFIPKNPSAHAIPIERLLQASEVLPHKLSGSIAATTDSVAAASGRIASPSNGVLAEIERIIEASANAPVPARYATMTNDKLAGLVTRLEHTGSDKLSLNLRNSQLTDDSLPQLLRLQGRVKKINLEGTGITEEGSLWLRRNFPKASITVPSRYEMAKNAALKAMEAGSK